SVGKIRQDYRITLKKTTYPVEGTLTIKEIDESGGTGNKKVFNITSVPVYDNTIYKPVLVGGKYWAPVNVGSISTTYSADVDGCGSIFQWGRNVPLTYGSDDKQAGPVSAADAYGIYATMFITSESDWLDVPKDDLWSGDNAQGPCPNGWRVPTKTELDILQVKYQGDNFDVDNDNRLRIPHDPEQTGDDLYLPAAGHRYGADASPWSNRGSSGRYWSSTTSESDAPKVYRFYFGSGSSNTTTTSPRADGYSVRCIQK
ncbi:MAG: fibrobacter succinogenes major paralogous domain-containing protein, partial [Prevotella sp.]|nr:fibrobacter succinogenes major paralogous domain-containing protein [Prevotella sp.]